MCVVETGSVSALAESFGDDGGILLTGSFFPASLPFIFYLSEGHGRGVVLTLQKVGSGFSWG